MELLRLSERIKASKNPAAYHRMFVQAATEGSIIGVIELADVIRLPSSKAGGQQREVSDYAIIPTPEFEQWHTETVTTTNANAPRRSNAPRFADLIAGRVSVEDAAQHTAKRLAQRRERNAKTAQRARQRRAADQQPEVMSTPPELHDEYANL